MNTGGWLKTHEKDIARIQHVSDPLILAILFWLVSVATGQGTFTTLEYRIEISILLLCSILLSLGKLYQSYRQISLWKLVRRLSTSWGMVLSGLLLLGFLFKITANFSRLDFTIWAILSWLYLLLTHVGGRMLLRWHRIHGGNIRTVAFWGSPRHAVTFFQQLQSMPFLGLRLAAWFEPPNSQPMTLPEAMPPCAGGIREMSEWLSHNAVDQIYFSYASDRNISMEEVIRFLGDTCKPVYYLPVWSNTSMRFAVEQIGASYCINLWNGEDSILNQQLKRTFDIIFAASGLLLISPVLLVLAALVKLSSPGPILFKQDRSGIDGKTFKMYKFRTMTVTEDGNTPGLQQARRNDPRVTPIGRILRRWSLDELPQLFNVLEGSMSLVGPRPHAVEHNQQYRKLISGYMQRHLFKPGITGLAQVEGWRGETAQLELMARRVEADLRYLRDWSIALDLKILIKTILRLRSPSAY